MRNLVVTPTITPRNNDVLDRYFKDIEKISMISPGEEEELYRRITSGKREAIARLVKANLRFVITVAKQYQTTGVTLSDLISEGNIGLMRAAERFDHTKGFKFISYAVWWIRQAITTAIHEHTRFIHLPLNQLTILTQYGRTSNQLEQCYGRSVTHEEVAAELGLQADSLTGLLSQKITLSLDKPLNNDTATTLCETISCNWPPPDEDLVRESVKQEIEDALGILSRREHDLICLYFGLDKQEAVRLEDIAQRLRLSVEHTRRLKDGALKKLRLSTKSNGLRTCFQ